MAARIVETASRAILRSWQWREPTLLMICDRRGIAVDDIARARISGERDVRRLDRWSARALNAATIDEVLSGW